MAQGMEKGTSGTGSMATEMAVGLTIAQQMMQQHRGLVSNMVAQPSVAAPVSGSLRGGGLAEHMTPAQVAQALGVSEHDVMAIVDSGQLRPKKIGSSVRIMKTALGTYLVD